jgi:lipoprotein-releasing system permease protein
MGLGAEAYIAFRYLRSKRRSRLLSLISVLAVGGVGLGVAALIVVLAVLAGFETNFKEKLLGLQAHVTVYKPASNIADWDRAVAAIRRVPGVASVQPIATGQVMAASSDGATGVILMGIDPEIARESGYFEPMNLSPHGLENLTRRPMSSPYPIPSGAFSDDGWLDGDTRGVPRPEELEILDFPGPDEPEDGAEPEAAAGTPGGEGRIETLDLDDVVSGASGVPSSSPAVRDAREGGSREAASGGADFPPSAGGGEVSSPPEGGGETVSESESGDADASGTEDGEDDSEPEDGGGDPSGAEGAGRDAPDGPGGFPAAAGSGTEPPQGPAASGGYHPPAEPFGEGWRGRVGRRAPGLAEAPEPAPERGIILGSELSMLVGQGALGEVNVISPFGRVTPIGRRMPLSAIFRVAGVFRTNLFDYDSRVAFTTIRDAQEILGMDDTVSAIEIMCDDIYRAGEVRQLVLAALGPEFWGRDWMQMNMSLFSALKLEQTAMFVILTLIILVAAFNIASTLVMMVTEKTRDIAILKAMGATGGQVRRIFTIQGLAVGGAGTLGGFAVGMLLCFLLARYEFISLPPEVYLMSTLPVEMRPLQIVAILAVSMAISFLATLYPSAQAAKLDPVEAIRYE